jgi:BirA family biotin operon repressor/biotin-[acetyl-CoA-carboxylase] ligase
MTDDPRAALTAERLGAHLGTRWLGRAFEWHAEVPSTNDLAATRAREDAPEGLVIATDAQTAGRGRLGRAWHSPAGESLYVSMLLRPARPAPEVPPVTLLAGAAVARALARLGFAPRLKWPNDVQLVVDGGVRKVAGLLTEMATEGGRVGHVVVGLGLNVNAAAFPDELADKATSLRLAGGRALDRAVVLAAVLDAFEPLYDEYRAEGPTIAAAAWEPFAALGSRCRVGGPGQTTDVIEGVTLGLDPDGALRVRDDAGRVHRVLSGEIAT